MEIKQSDGLIRVISIMMQFELDGMRSWSIRSSSVVVGTYYGKKTWSNNKTWRA